MFNTISDRPYRSTYFIVLFALLSSFVFMSCAAPTTTKSPADMQTVLPDLEPGKCRVVFFRPRAFIGFAMSARIYLDAKLVGSSRNGTYFNVDVRPGKHKVTIGKKIWPGPGHTLVQFETKENDTVYVKTWIGASSFVGRTSAAVVESTEALSVIKGLKQVSIRK